MEPYFARPLLESFARGSNGICSASGTRLLPRSSPVYGAASRVWVHEPPEAANRPDYPPLLLEYISFLIPLEPRIAVALSPDSARLYLPLLSLDSLHDLIRSRLQLHKTEAQPCNIVVEEFTACVVLWERARGGHTGAATLSGIKSRVHDLAAESAFFGEFKRLKPGHTLSFCLQTLNCLPRHS